MSDGLENKNLNADYAVLLGMNTYAEEKNFDLKSAAASVISLTIKSSVSRDENVMGVAISPSVIVTLKSSSIQAWFEIFINDQPATVIREFDDQGLALISFLAVSLIP